MIASVENTGVLNVAQRKKEQVVGVHICEQ